MDARAGVKEGKRKGQGVHPSSKGRLHHNTPIILYRHVPSACAFAVLCCASFDTLSLSCQANSDRDCG